MAEIDLKTLLSLVGSLSDSTDVGSASHRFRDYLSTNVETSAVVDDYIRTALENSGDQFNKALQDLINHLGDLLGFNVTYGRYRGTRGAVGFDGHWKSPTGWSIIVETKTTDTYTVRTDALLGYINALVSDGQVTGRDRAVGLYVYGRFDSNTNQLENAITIENRQNQLRVVSVDALLSLLELKQEYGLSHDEVLGLLRPAPIRIDHIVDLIRGVVAKEQEKDVIDQGLDEPKNGGSGLTILPPATPFPKRGQSSVKVSEDFTGKSLYAITLFGKQRAVTKWNHALLTLFMMLLERDRSGFEAAAPMLVGRKRPYVTTEPGLLRQPGKIDSTNLYYETNLSANQISRISWELMKRMGFQKDDLQFEVN
jgi:hypothetical protein